MLAQPELAFIRLELARELATAVLAADADEQHRRRVARLVLRVNAALEQGDSSEEAFVRRRQRIASEWGLTSNGTRPRAHGSGQRHADITDAAAGAEPRVIPAGR